MSICYCIYIFSEDPVDPQDATPPKKRLRSSVNGLLHDPKKCVWCRNGPDERHPDRKTSKCHRIGNNQAWIAFKRHTITIDDDEALKDRLNKLIETTTDPFAADILYHKACWNKYISYKQLTDSDKLHLQNVSLSEARSLFFRHIDEVIFKQHEIRTLQSLLLEYKSIVSNHGYQVGYMKSSYLKEILVSEFKDDIGFQKRRAKNLSELVFDTRGGGDYIQYAVESFGITDEQLIDNMVPRIVKDIKKSQELPWPPTLEELEEGDEISHLLCRMLTRMKHPTRKTLDFSPETLSLASLVSQYVTGRRSAHSINMSITAHGMMRSRVLVDIMKKSAVFISYADILLLYDFWTLQDVELSAECPAELTEGKPAIAVCDNDDFPYDTLSGNAELAHWTNVMYVQPKIDSEKSEDRPRPPIIEKKEISVKLKEMCENLTKVDQYRCPPGASSEPPIRKRVEPTVDSCMSQRRRSVNHALRKSASL